MGSISNTAPGQAWINFFGTHQPSNTMSGFTYFGNISQATNDAGQTTAQQIAAGGFLTTIAAALTYQPLAPNLTEWSLQTTNGFFTAVNWAAQTNGFYSIFYPASNPSAFISGNQSISIGGIASGSGATSITLVSNATFQSEVLGLAALNQSGFLTANQTITIGGIGTGSGSTAITIVSNSLFQSEVLGLAALNQSGFLTAVPATYRTEVQIGSSNFLSSTQIGSSNFLSSSQVGSSNFLNGTQISSSNYQTAALVTALINAALSAYHISNGLMVASANLTNHSALNTNSWIPASALAATLVTSNGFGSLSISNGTFTRAFTNRGSYNVWIQPTNTTKASVYNSAGTLVATNTGQPVLLQIGWWTTNNGGGYAQ